jgi:hypothetical protein
MSKVLLPKVLLCFAVLCCCAFQHPKKMRTGYTRFPTPKKKRKPVPLLSRREGGGGIKKTASWSGRQYRQANTQHATHNTRHTTGNTQQATQGNKPPGDTPRAWTPALLLDTNPKSPKAYFTSQKRNAFGDCFPRARRYGERLRLPRTLETCVWT